MNTKICTSIEQSKKLLELGLDINTADMTVTNLPLQDGNRFNFICCKLPADTFPSITDGKSEKIPAWSLSALLKFMPKLKTNYGMLRPKMVIEEGNKFQYRFYYEIIYYTGMYEFAIDAAFEMVCWLLENKKPLYTKTLI